MYLKKPEGKMLDQKSLHSAGACGLNMYSYTALAAFNTEAFSILLW